MHYLEKKTSEIIQMSTFSWPQLARAAPVCRAGGKPSTWFPPGTRRAEPAFHVLPLRDLHVKAFYE